MAMPDDTDAVAATTKKRRQALAGLMATLADGHASARWGRPLK